jgi:acyl carrier protein
LNRFFQAAAKVLEVDEVGLSTDFRAIDGWCSLNAFGLLVMMESDFAAPIAIDAFNKFKTVGDLYREAVVARAASILGVARASLSPQTQRADIPEWDSVNHLRLVMELERDFGVRYSLELIPEMNKLSDFAVE